MEENMLVRTGLFVVPALGMLWAGCQNNNIQSNAESEVAVAQAALTVSATQSLPTHHMTCGAYESEAARPPEAPRLDPNPFPAEKSVTNAVPVVPKQEGGYFTPPRPISAATAARYRAYEAELARLAAEPAAANWTAAERNAAAIALKAEMIPEGTEAEVVP
jgi:hypothetical protein